MKKRKENGNGKHKRKRSKPARGKTPQRKTQKGSGGISTRKNGHLADTKQRKPTKSNRKSVPDSKGKLASQRSKKGWETRRKNAAEAEKIAQQIRQEIARKKSEASQRSKKGWETRKLKEYGVDKGDGYSNEHWDYNIYHLNGDIDENVIERIISRELLNAKPFSILLKIRMDFPGIGPKWISSPYVEGVPGVAELLLELFEKRRKRYINPRTNKEDEDEDEEDEDGEEWLEAVVLIRYN